MGQAAWGSFSVPPIACSAQEAAGAGISAGLVPEGLCSKPALLPHLERQGWSTPKLLVVQQHVLSMYFVPGGGLVTWSVDG